MRKASMRPAWVIIAFLIAGVCRGRPAPDGVLDPTWNDTLDYLSTRGSVTGLFRTTRPYDVDAIIDALERAESTASNDLDRRLASRLLESWDYDNENGLNINARAELRWRPEQNPRLLPTFRAALRYAHPSGVTLFQEFDIAPEAGRVSTLPGGSTAQFRVRPWNPEGIFPDEGYVADFTRAAVRLPIAGLNVSIGRQPHDWGPGRRAALTLSDASPSLDGVVIDGTFGKVKGTAVFSVLNRMWSGTGDRRYLARRYFSARRAHWKPSERFEFGIMDAILYGGDLRPPEIYYLNPALPFYASQFNATNESTQASLDDNAMIGVDARWTPREGWSLYGELLIDDYRYDPESNDPQSLGWLAGLHRAGWRNRGEWRLEYSRANRYAYTHLAPENQYTHYGASLGHPLGNDADLLYGSFSRFLSPDARVSFSVEQRRKGDSGVDDRFRGESDTAFLNGSAETRRAIAFGGWARFGSGWFVQSDVTLVFVRSRDHVFGAGESLIEWRGAFAKRLQTGL